MASPHNGSDSRTSKAGCLLALFVILGALGHACSPRGVDV